MYKDKEKQKKTDSARQRRDIRIFSWEMKICEGCIKQDVCKYKRFEDMPPVRNIYDGSTVKPTSITYTTNHN